MARSTEFWIKFQQVFNPYEVLVEQRSQDFYCERLHSPFEDLLDDFRSDLQRNRPPVAFFAGHRGSGKSSMLYRLLDQLKADYFIVYFDIEHNLEKDKAAPIDLLYLLGVAIFNVALAENLDPEEENLMALVKSVYKTVFERKETEKEEINIADLLKGVISFGATILAGGIGQKLAEAATKGLSSSAAFSEEVGYKREVEPHPQTVINQINLIIADVETKAGKPLLVVVDGLDKLTKADQARQIFIESRALRAPLCGLIYTVPMLVFGEQKFDEVEDDCASRFFPNINIYSKHDDSPNPEGHQLMGEVIFKRLSALGLKANNELFNEEALAELILKSGGVMRWLIELARDSGRQAERMNLDQINRQAVNRAIENFAAKKLGRLGIDKIEELRKTRKEKRYSGAPASLELLHSRLIVAYRNGRPWYDAHPLTWEEL